jgi:proteasome lid subunit RPN8/RPN11
LRGFRGTTHDDGVGHDREEDALLINHRLIQLNDVRRSFARRGLLPTRPAWPPALPEDVPNLHPLTTEELRKPAPMLMTREVYESLRDTVGTVPPETGGMLGGQRGTGLVDHVFLDRTADVSGVTYSPDIDQVNRVLRDEWNPEGINLLGFVHSHPHGSVRPSGPDVSYAERILRGIPELDRMLLPIAQSRADGDWSLAAYAVDRAPGGAAGRLVRLPLEVVAPRPRPDLESFRQFARVTDAYDLAVVSSSRVLAVGVGGSAGFLEDLARSGVGEFVLIDPDVVELPNLATQQTYAADLGLPKVTALGRRLARVNPHAHIWTVQAPLDALDDAAVRRLAVAPLPGGFPDAPSTTLLCGFTDSFWAQARTNRLALQLGLPQLQGQVYREGRGAELVFTAPGLTGACARCVLSSRYAAYLERGFTNDVTSNGTPLWATSRLNAVKGPVSMALLHATSTAARPDHPATRRYRRLAERIADRNLVMLRLDPDIGEHLGLSVFDRLAAAPEGHRLVTDEALWLPQLPDHPDNGRRACPDCGGSGDLSGSIGRIDSTVPRPLG